MSSIEESGLVNGQVDVTASTDGCGPYEHTARFYGWRCAHCGQDRPTVTRLGARAGFHLHTMICPQ